MHKIFRSTLVTVDIFVTFATWKNNQNIVIKRILGFLKAIL